MRAGYLVCTGADIDTAQARTGVDITLQAAAFASGAQFVSTDYVVADPDFGTGYTAAVPGGCLGRCNPRTAPNTCDAAPLSQLDEREGSPIH